MKISKLICYNFHSGTKGGHLRTLPPSPLLSTPCWTWSILKAEKIARTQKWLHTFMSFSDCTRLQIARFTFKTPPVISILFVMSSPILSHKLNSLFRKIIHQVSLSNHTIALRIHNVIFKAPYNYMKSGCFICLNHIKWINLTHLLHKPWETIKELTSLPFIQVTHSCISNSSVLHGHVRVQTVSSSLKNCCNH